MKKTLLTLLSAALMAGVNAQEDWMVTQGGYKASVVEKDGQLSIGNGLVERRIMLGKVGTTVALNNLILKQGMLRSVRPEAEITIDGMTLRVGGMTGQKVHNFLRKEWLEQMSADQSAMIFTSYKVQPIGARFDWKARKEWMAVDPSWPPKGKEIILSYQVGDELLEELAQRSVSDMARERLFVDDFQKLNPEWQIHFSGQNNAAVAFCNEGKAGEIMVKANTAAYGQISLPAKTQVVMVEIAPGTESAATWGVGMAWIFDQKTIKFNLRTAEQKFAVNGLNDFEMMFQGLKPGQTVKLRMENTEGVIRCSYSYDQGVSWVELCQGPVPMGMQSRALRVGKMDWGSGSGEHTELGDVGRSQIIQVTALGKATKTDKSRTEYLKQLKVNVHYEIYDGVPLMCKWISIENGSSQQIVVEKYKSEILAIAEPEAAPIFDREFRTANITVETDMVHAAKGDPKNPESKRTVNHHANWVVDPLYKTQVDWSLRTPCLLVSSPEYGPAEQVAPAERFESHRTWELLHDTWERERRSLQIRRMYRTIAPWVAENPIFMHVRSADNESVKKAIDQCASVGFEMVIMTFWSGIDMEDTSKTNLNRMKYLADYAHSKGVALGGYSLLASRSIDAKNNVVSDQGRTPTFGSSPCLLSDWGMEYMDKIYNYFKFSGQDILEHDGSYPGDECASQEHPGHKGLEDSQWKQYKAIQALYHWAKSQGIFLNIPDWYFVNGGNKTGMGYREANWSLPRAEQEIIERQNIYDGTWDKTPSMGWMMVPLVEYQGGGAAATIEPLKEHLTHYDMRLANNFGAGVIACYRGPELYDAPQTEAVVCRWVDFYKKYRRILNGDIIHLRRPDGLDWDGVLHVDPTATDYKGLLMVYNPTAEPIKRTITLPLYYTGLTKMAHISEQGLSKGKNFIVGRDYSTELSITIPAGGYNWYVIW
ncbi:MAG: hypothetical protein RR066_00670 [Mucinivorans sp.]